jgi:DNA ligase-1
MAMFLAVAELAEMLAGEASRLKKRAAIAEAISRAHEDVPESEDAGWFAMYVAGTPFAEADSRKLNAGGALLTKALLAVSGATNAELTAAYKRHGDLGAAGFDLLSMAGEIAKSGRAAHDAHLGAMKPHEGSAAGADGTPGSPPQRAKTLAGDPGFVAGLTLGDVAEAFAGMAVARTTAVRAGLVEGLLRRATALEAKYLLKLMIGDMRIGVKQSLVEEAIAVAASKPMSESPDAGHPVLVSEVRHAVMLEADLSAAVRRAFAGTLKEARMRLFHPLGFMLASPVETPEEAVERFAGKPVVKVVVKRRKKNGVEVEEAVESSGDGEEADATTDATATTNTTTGPSTRAARIAQDDTFWRLGGKRTSNDNSKNNDKDEMRGSLHSATDDETVCRSGRDDDLSRMTSSVMSSSGRGGNSLIDESGIEKKRQIEAFLEDKYDGMRAQVHCGDAGQAGRVAIYSRNREDVTESFPELEEAFALVGSTGVGPLIFDGEILGWDLSSARALPFAVLGQRIGRKRVSNEWRQQIPVVFMAFDLMVADGELVLDLPLRERRNKLEAVVERLVEVVRSPLVVDERKRSAQGVMFAEADGQGVERLMIAPSRLVESAEDIERAYAEARARANEGVMLKAAGSVYQPGRRGLAWVKLKRELATLDVVVTGAEFGHGKRAGILSDYTFAVRGAGGEFLNVGKAYSGLTDAEIAEMSAWMMEHTLEDRGFFRTVEPLMVLEVAFNNIMRSGRHASGFALRFPRILRIRTDKPVGEIDTVERVEEVYQSQVDKPVELGI